MKEIEKKMEDRKAAIAAANRTDYNQQGKVELTILKRHLPSIIALELFRTSCAFILRKLCQICVFIFTFSNYQIHEMNDTTIDEKDLTDERTIAETTQADVTTTAVLDPSVKMMIVVQDLCAETNHEAERGHIGETIAQTPGETIGQILEGTIGQNLEGTIAQIQGETIAQIQGETIDQIQGETSAQILEETSAQIQGETNGMIEAGGMSEIGETTEGMSERTMVMVGMLETGTPDRMINHLGLKKKRIPQSEFNDN